MGEQIGPEEKKIMAKIDAEQAKLGRHMRNRTAVDDTLEALAGLTKLEVSDQAGPSGCDDHAQQVTSRIKLGSILRKAESRKK